MLIVELTSLGMDTTYRALGGPIRQFLRERAMTISELAEAIDYDRSTVSTAINGTRPMSWDVGNAIAVALGVKHDAVMEPIMPPEREPAA